MSGADKMLNCNQIKRHANVITYLSDGLRDTYRNLLLSGNVIFGNVVLTKWIALRIIFFRTSDSCLHISRRSASFIVFLRKLFRNKDNFKTLADILVTPQLNISMHILENGGIDRTTLVSCSFVSLSNNTINLHSGVRFFAILIYVKRYSKLIRNYFRNIFDNQLIFFNTAKNRDKAEANVTWICLLREQAFHLNSIFNILSLPQRIIIKLSETNP